MRQKIGLRKGRWDTTYHTIFQGRFISFCKTGVDAVFGCPSAHSIDLVITDRNPKRKGWTKAVINPATHMLSASITLPSVGRSFFLNQSSVWDDIPLREFWFKVEGIGKEGF